MIDNAASAATPLVSVRGLRKTYGAIAALHGIDIAFREGSVHGLVGANGAGKSTLVRSLAGLEQPDSGSIQVRGEHVRLANPGDAARIGFAFIHQELNLVSDFTAAQNIILGTERHHGLQLRGFHGVTPEAQAAAARVGIEFDLNTPASELTVHQQWLVSIARALVQDCRLIAMDEPTASLDADEARRLLAVVRDLASQGVAVVFISHRLDEVIEICDQITVFKDGEVALSIQRDRVTRTALVEAIVGRDVTPGTGRHGDAMSSPSDVLLQVDHIRAGKGVRDASLTARRGEILGIAGLVGSGRTELARVIFGADRADGGDMYLNGHRYSPASVVEAVSNGVAYVPEERRAEALFLDLPVESNLHVTTWRQSLISGTPFVSTRRSRATAQATAQQLGVVLRSGGVGQSISGLSGGNQQKVVIGRWLQTSPDLLILDEPTRGVDVGARADIYAHIRDIAGKGTAVIVISSDFEELLECDRVTVMSSGATIEDLHDDAIAVDNMLRHCYAA